MLAEPKLISLKRHECLIYFMYSIVYTTDTNLESIKIFFAIFVSDYENNLFISQSHKVTLRR